MIIITKVTRCDSKYQNRSVRVIDNAGSMIGIMDFDKALNLATSRGFDLILMSEANIPVMKMGDFNKMLYEQKKKEKESKKNQNTPKLKEIDFSINIGEKDYQVKLKHIKQFLSEHDNVKVVVKMDRRVAMNNSQFGFDMINQIIEDLKADCTYMNKPKLVGSHVFVTLNPIKK